MNSKFNLKEIERKAFRSTFQDGLWDMYLGLIVICMSVFLYRPLTGFSSINIIICVSVFVLSYGLFLAGKKFITLPRMGLVHFGEIRKRKLKTLAIIMGGFVLLTVALVVLTSIGWKAISSEINLPIPSVKGGSDLPLVAGLVAFIVGGSMACWAAFSDFLRGFYIAVMMTLAVFLMILINLPVIAIIIGALIFLPGLAIFIKFLKDYPLTA